MTAQPQQNQREYESTYLVQDRQNLDEMARLILLDQMITTAMGGPLPDQKSPEQFHRILDIGCGPGGWGLTTAQAYPHTEVYGIDISRTMVAEANHRAAEAGNRNAKFEMQDALLYLQFPEGFFDLVNMRFGVSFMRQWDWANWCAQVQRVLKVGGVVRLVEAQIGYTTNSELTTFYTWLRQAMHQAGHLFTESPNGLIDELPKLLALHRFENIQSIQQTMEYQGGTATGKILAALHERAFQTMHPFLQHWGNRHLDYGQVVAQARKEMNSPDFEASHTIHTFWAKNPARKHISPLSMEFDAE